MNVQNTIKEFAIISVGSAIVLQQSLFHASEPCVCGQRRCIGEPIVNYVLHELHSGATRNEIIGAYDRTPKMEMVPS